MVIIKNNEEPKNQVEKLEKELEEKKRILKEQKKEIVDKQQSFDKLEADFFKCSEKLQFLNSPNEELRKHILEVKADIAETKKNIRFLDAVLKSMNDDVILIHTSARLSHLYHHQLAEIWVTDVDKNFFVELEDKTDCLFSVENVFSMKSMNMKFPKNIFIKYKEREEELQSVIAFCGMALYFKEHKKENQTVYLAHRNKEIYRILKMNGVKDLLKI